MKTGWADYVTGQARKLVVGNWPGWAKEGSGLARFLRPEQTSVTDQSLAAIRSLTKAVHYTASIAVAVY